MSIHVLDEANRCLHCKAPQCQKGCPIHTPIPQIITMLQEGRLDEAGRTLFENNPSPLCAAWCATMKTSARATVCWAKRERRAFFRPLRITFPARTAPRW